jgi:GNAT superfamily N-acetyltransferase
MPWVVRDAVDEINRAVGRRWQDLRRRHRGHGHLAGLRRQRSDDAAAARLQPITVIAVRPAGAAAPRPETRPALAVQPARAWLAERDGEPVVQPPEESRWITGMTRAGVTAYLQTMFVRPGDRGGGVGEALVRHVHAVLDARGVDTTLLHYAQLNPLSAPFWIRMGYRPLWTGWEVRPAASLR